MNRTQSLDQPDPYNFATYFDYFLVFVSIGGSEHPAEFRKIGLLQTDIQEIYNTMDLFVTVIAL